MSEITGTVVEEAKQGKFYSQFRNFSPGVNNDIWAFLFLTDFYKLIKDM